MALGPPGAPAVSFTLWTGQVSLAFPEKENERAEPPGFLWEGGDGRAPVSFSRNGHASSRKARVSPDAVAFPRDSS